MVGQDEAVVAVSNAVRRSRAGLADPESARTVRSCSLGPTGVGKTELCKASGRVPVRQRAGHGAAWICPSSWRSIRWLSLIGAPPGYVGYEEGGYLTEAVRRRPYSLFCCWMRWRRRTRMCSTSCCRCWRMVA